MPLTPIQLNQLEESATGRALDTLIKGQFVLESFSDFTTGLIREVLNTVVQSSMDQLEAYGDLVATVAGSLADYEQRTFPNLTTDTGEVIKYIADYIRPNYGFTASWTGFSRNGGTYTPTSAALDPAKLQAFKDLFAGVVVKIAGVDKVIGDSGIIGALASGSHPIGSADLYAFALAKFRKEIKGTYDRLVSVLKLGMQKVVITDGKISTRLVFHVSGLDSDSLQSSNTTSDYTVTSTTFGGGLAGSFFRGALGINLGGSRSRYNSSVKVNVVNEQKTAVTSLDVDITGGVELNFRTDYFPSFDPTVG